MADFERNPEVNYKNYEDRTVDSQYQDLLREIFENGETIGGLFQSEEARAVFGAQFKFDMANGFPLITERDMSQGMFSTAIAEHIAFLNGARTQEELEEFGCKVWAKWLTEEQTGRFNLEPGDMGDGSYGAAWGHFPLNTEVVTHLDGVPQYTAVGSGFDQISNLMKQIKKYPSARTHMISSWIPQFALQHDELRRNVVVAPCHGIVHVLVNSNRGTFTVHHFQRSGDLPVGVTFNMVQYAAFGMLLARITGLTFDKYVHTFSDVHIYERQYGHVEELLSREPRRFGTVILGESAEGIDNIKDFRPEHFELTDYHAHPRMIIPTPL